MPKASPIILNFSSGELSSLFDGRVDLEEYPSGCSEIRNMIPLLQGPVTRRPGLRHVREVKDSTDRCGYLTFQFNVTQSYVLELGDLYMRFYTNHGIVLNGTNPLELTTIWTAADLFDSDGNFMLRSYQSGDVMYITHISGSYPVQKLIRTGALSWSIDDFLGEGGPFESVDPDNTITVYASAVSGSVTVTASSAIFNSDHVGSLFLIEQKIADDNLPWEAGKAITSGNYRRVDNRNYQALNTATTGGVTPTHSSGSAYDGGVSWQFLDAGYGYGLITAVNSAGTVATMTVQSRLPVQSVASGNATTLWAFGSWSNDLGWPTHVTNFRERLTFAKSSSLELDLSESGDFERFRQKDFSGEVVTDSAIKIQITSPQSNPIEWMVAADTLLVGTAGGEFAVGEITTNEPLGPGNIKADQKTSYGSKSVDAITVSDSVLFVQRSGRKLRDLSFSIEIDGFRSTNLSILSPHLLPIGKAITQIAYQQEPDSIIWVLRSDGALLATTINANQKRFGWHRHPIGGNGIVEAIAVIPTPSGDSDELWLIVRRTINGATKRYVEYLEDKWDGENEDIVDAFYLDSGLTYEGYENATLTPGAGATVAGSTGITFTAGSSVFSSGDVGKEIRYRYQDDDDVYHTSRAEITSFTNNTTVVCTIISAFPSLASIAANAWGVTATTITGLSHLEGETIRLLVDGSPHNPVTVSSGSINLSRPAIVVHAGLLSSCIVKTMRVEAGSVDGTAQSKIKRTHRCGVRLKDTVGGSCGPDSDNKDQILFRGASALMDEPLPPFTGDKLISWPDGYTTDGTFMYENDDPLPATVIAFIPRLYGQDG